MREIFVEKSFDGKSVLVTGATGFLGKLLVEKLLSSCTGIEKIFIFLTKNDNEIVKRLECFKSSAVFEVLRRNNEKALDKLVAVEGDLMKNHSAGISIDDLAMLKKSVNFIIHCAATTKFDEPFKAAIEMSTISTRNLLNLAQTFDNLEAFVHVSTAYSNTNLKVIYEKIYEPVIDYKLAIELIKTNRDDELEELREIAMTVFPNTYVISQNLTEHLLLDRSKHLPIAIVRPSIICPTFMEPEEDCDGERCKIAIDDQFKLFFL